MDTIWTLINGLIYVVAFALLAWILLDAKKVSDAANK